MKKHIHYTHTHTHTHTHTLSLSLSQSPPTHTHTHTRMFFFNYKCIDVYLQEITQITFVHSRKGIVNTHDFRFNVCDFMAAPPRSVTFSIFSMANNWNNQFCDTSPSQSFNHFLEMAVEYIDVECTYIYLQICIEICIEYI